LIALPEAFVYRGADLEKRWETAELIPGPLSAELAALAKQLGVYLLAGSYPERPGPADPSHESDPRTYNTSLFFGPDGGQLAKYRKIHMFDVEVAGGVTAKESARNRSGTEIVTADTEYGKMGLTICYDLRFPEVFRAQALQGVMLSFVPANFALFTGKDHWEVLLRARAIETGIYIVAPATIGRAGEFQAYGRSLIVDPWGTVITTMSDEEGFTMAMIDTERVKRVQQSLPSLKNRAPAAY
jgi:predicted amidohydrolase